MTNAFKPSATRDTDVSLRREYAPIMTSVSNELYNHGFFVDEAVKLHGSKDGDDAERMLALHTSVLLMIADKMSVSGHAEGMLVDILEEYLKEYETGFSEERQEDELTDEMINELEPEELLSGGLEDEDMLERETEVRAEEIVPFVNEFLGDNELDPAESLSTAGEFLHCLDRMNLIGFDPDSPNSIETLKSIRNSAPTEVYASSLELSLWMELASDFFWTYGKEKTESYSTAVDAFVGSCSDALELLYLAAETGPLATSESMEETSKKIASFYEAMLFEKEISEGKGIEAAGSQSKLKTMEVVSRIKKAALEEVEKAEGLKEAKRADEYFGKERERKRRNEGERGQEGRS